MNFKVGDYVTIRKTGEAGFIDDVEVHRWDLDKKDLHRPPCYFYTIPNKDGVRIQYRMCDVAIYEFKEGDIVEILSEEYKGNAGRIKCKLFESSGDPIRYEVLTRKEKIIQLMEHEMKFVRGKHFEEGNIVKIIKGDHKGKMGLIMFVSNVAISSGIEPLYSLIINDRKMEIPHSYLQLLPQEKKVDEDDNNNNKETIKERKSVDDLSIEELEEILKKKKKEEVPIFDRRKYTYKELAKILETLDDAGAYVDISENGKLCIALDIIHNARIRGRIVYPTDK